jgi:hypothetical protein
MLQTKPACQSNAIALLEQSALSTPIEHSLADLHQAVQFALPTPIASLPAMELQPMVDASAIMDSNPIHETLMNVLIKMIVVE